MIADEARDKAQEVFNNEGTDNTEYSHTLNEVIVDTPDGKVVEL